MHETDILSSSFPVALVSLETFGHFKPFGPLWEAFHERATQLKPVLYKKRTSKFQNRDLCHCINLYFRWCVLAFEGPQTILYIYIYILRKPASWLVAVCERSENRGCGGGGCRKGTKSRRAPVLSTRKRSILLDYVPLGNLLTVGYRFPLGPPFWWPERPWGCIGKYNETAGKHDNDQRKSYKIPCKTDENGANARNKPWKIPWKMEETGANARRKPWRYSKHAGKIQWKCRKMW